MTFTFFFSFKDVLTEVTCNTTSTIAFMRKHGIIKSEVHCSGPSINGSCSFPCGGYMVSKKQMIQKIKKFGDAGKHTQLLKAIVNTL